MVPWECRSSSVVIYRATGVVRCRPAAAGDGAMSTSPQTRPSPGGDASAPYEPIGSSDAVSPPQSHARVTSLISRYSRFAVIAAYFLMVILFSALKPDTFLTMGTFKDLLDQCAVPVTLVCGLVFVLAVGEFDLSFTATVGLCAAIVIILISKHGSSILVACVLGLLAAVVVGLIVGLLVTLGRA